MISYRIINIYFIQKLLRHLRSAKKFCSKKNFLWNLSANERNNAWICM